MFNDGSVSAVNTLKELTNLVENMLLLLSEKEKMVIIRRFDLDGKGKATLEEIGQEFNVTRERIRQIEKNALVKMKRNVFNTSLKALHEMISEFVIKNGGIMKTETLISELRTAVPEVKENGLNFSFVLHEDLESTGNTINFHPYLRHKKIPEYNLKYVSNNLINQLHKYGDTKNITKLHQDLKEKLKEVDFNITKVKSLIEIDKRITLIKDNLVGLTEWRHIQPRTLRDKIAYILRSENKPLHFAEIAERISNEKFDTRKVNIQAVHNELIRHDQFVLIGRGIYALTEWGYERGTVADVIEKLLSNGKEMEQQAIIDEVLKQRQVKKITIILALKNSGKFTRIGRKVYKIKS